MELEANGMCFACGKQNPIGLKLEFVAQGDEHTGELTIAENYQGWAGIAHGGILATALDEIMARLLIDRGYMAITAKLEVRFRRPAKVGDTLLLKARLVNTHGRVLETEAEAISSDGTTIAEAKATSMVSKNTGF